MKSKIIRELLRTLPILAVALLVLFADPSNKVVLFSIGVMAALILISHLARKLLFPYIDLEALLHERSMPDAVIFFSVCYVLSTIISSVTSLLR